MTAGQSEVPRDSIKERGSLVWGGRDVVLMSFSDASFFLFFGVCASIADYTSGVDGVHI